MNESNKIKISKYNKKRVETLKFIHKYRAQHRYGPSVRTLRDHFHLKSKSPALARFRILEKLGYIEREPGIAYAVWVTKAGRQFIKDFEDEVERATRDARTQWETAEW